MPTPADCHLTSAEDICMTCSSLYAKTCIFVHADDHNIRRERSFKGCQPRCAHETVASIILVAAVVVPMGDKRCPHPDLCQDVQTVNPTDFLAAFVYFVNRDTRLPQGYRRTTGKDQHSAFSPA